MNWVHLHLAVNHIPVLGNLFVALLLVTGLAKGSQELMRLSCLWFVVLAAVSIPIKFTGDFAHETVADAPWLPAESVLAHEQAADQATTGMFLLGLVAAFGLFRARGERDMPSWILIGTLLVALVTFGLMARTAYWGGQLRHTEIRGTAVSSLPATPLQSDHV